MSIIKHHLDTHDYTIPFRFSFFFFFRRFLSFFHFILRFVLAASRCYKYCVRCPRGVIYYVYKYY